MNEREVPDVVNGYTKKIFFGCGHLYLTVNFDSEGQPIQVLAQVGKTGCCQRALLEATYRSINRQLEKGVPLDEIVSDLVGIRCDQGLLGAGRLSCVDAIGHALKKHVIEDREE